MFSQDTRGTDNWKTWLSVWRLLCRYSVRPIVLHWSLHLHSWSAKAIWTRSGVHFIVFDFIQCRAGLGNMMTIIVYFKWWNHDSDSRNTWECSWKFQCDFPMTNSYGHHLEHLTIDSTKPRHKLWITSFEEGLVVVIIFFPYYPTLTKEGFFKTQSQLWTV